MMNVYSASITVGDINAESPEDAANALLAWIMARSDDIYVQVEDALDDIEATVVIGVNGVTQRLR